MSDIRDELLTQDLGLKPAKHYFKRSNIIIVSVVLVLGWYIGILLFGNNSVLRLGELEGELDSLKKRVDYLQKDNAKLQKQLFEIKEIKGQK
ncbi:MAG: hypothetical protein ACTTIC_03930 [Helicobacteraceae bacterium]